MPEWYESLIEDIGGFFTSLGDRIADGISGLFSNVTEAFPFLEELATYIEKIPGFVATAYDSVDVLPPLIVNFALFSIIGSLAFLILGRSRVN